MKKIITSLAVAGLFATTAAHAELTQQNKNDLVRGAATALLTKVVAEKTHSKLVGVGAGLVANYAEMRLLEKHGFNGQDAVRSLAGSGVGLAFTKKF